MQTHNVVQIEERVSSDVVIWKLVIILNGDVQAGTSLFQQLGVYVARKGESLAVF